MKHLLYSTFLLFFAMTSFGQSEKYLNSMKGALENMKYEKPTEELQRVAHQMERIGNAESTEWLPYYYASIAYVMMAAKEMQTNGDRVGEFVEHAEKHLEKTLALEDQNSEVLTLKGYVTMANIWVNPIVNGALYGPKAVMQFDQAIEANPENPRPYSLKAQNLYYTPAMFGGGAETAKPIFLKAKEKFATFEPKSDIHPSWGEEANSYFMDFYDKEE